MMALAIYHGIRTHFLILKWEFELYIGLLVFGVPENYC